MKMKMKIKKHRNFIIVMITSGLIGGMLGGFHEEISKIDISFGGDINDLLFKTFLGISLVIVSYLAITITYIKSNYMKVDLDNIPKAINRKVSNAILLCTIQAIIGLTWDALVINKSFDKGELHLILVPTVFIFIAVFLLTITMKYYNYIYPNRKMNLFENGAEKKYFDKLDDGEKWVTYTCSYATFNKMQMVFTVAIVISIVLSMFLNVPIAVPMLIGIMWIIQNLIYSLEARKYEEK
jgi:hypothetical protein